MDPRARCSRSTAERPFFLFLHCYETHEPYTHTRFAEGMPSGRLTGEFSKEIWNRLRKRFSDEEMRYAEALYDGDIAYTDAKLGEFFAELEKRGPARGFDRHRDQRSRRAVLGERLVGSRAEPPRPPDPCAAAGLPARRDPGASWRGRIASRRPRPALTQGAIEDQVELVDLYPTLLELLGVELGEPGERAQPRLSVRRAGFASGPRGLRRAHQRQRSRAEGAAHATLQVHRFDPAQVLPDVYRRELRDLRPEARSGGSRTNLAPGLPDRVSSCARGSAGSWTARTSRSRRRFRRTSTTTCANQLKALGYIGN